MVIELAKMMLQGRRSSKKGEGEKIEEEEKPTAFAIPCPRGPVVISTP